MKRPGSSSAVRRSWPSPSFFIAGSYEWRPQDRPTSAKATADRHEAELELAAVGRLRRRGWRIVQLRIFRAISDHARFSMGESFVIWNRRRASALRLVSRVWATASLSRQNFRIDSCRDCNVPLRLLRLRNLLCASTSAAFGASAAGWPKSSRVHFARPKWKTGRPFRSALPERRGLNFLSGTLLT